MRRLRSRRSIRLRRAEGWRKAGITRKNSSSLNANQKPSWIARRIKGVATIWPEIFGQEEIKMTRWGVINPQLVKDGDGKVIANRFGDSSNPRPFVTDRSSGGKP